MAELEAPWPAVVGVSGGSDSLALMLLLRDWAASAGLPPPLVTCVDHGLRPESKREAKKVAGWVRAAGLSVYILAEEGPQPKADIEAAARMLRYRLMGDFARKKKLAAIYVAHTEDDQAETFLLRLARGSGVDGLSGMRKLAPYPLADYPSLSLVRPLLGFSRTVLREYLASQAQPWIDDPMNADPRFARVRIRQAWPLLNELGLTPRRLTEAAGHLGRARIALELASEAVLARASLPHSGGLLLDPQALAAAPPELGLRALATVLMLVSKNPYRPRFERLTGLYDALTEGSLGGGRTLHGCRIAPAPKAARLFGEVTLWVQPEKGRGLRGKGG